MLMCRTPFVLCNAFLYIYNAFFYYGAIVRKKKVNEKGNTFEEEDRKKNQEAPETR